MSAKSLITAADLQGMTRLLTDGTKEITYLVEDMQYRIVHPTYLPSTPVQHIITGISSLTYNSIRLGTQIFGGGLDRILGYLSLILGSEEVNSEKKDALLAVLNGVIGDHLEKSKNPLYLPMQFRYKGSRITLDADNIEATYPKINGKIVLMVHGLCMSDTKWSRNDHNHGEALAEDLNLTPVYLFYNGGRHISTNGQNLNDLIEQLVVSWPVQVKELYIVAHSMGGLVSRSAIYYAKQQKKSWTNHLKKIVFLGTPHHGTPLEKAGNYIDYILENTPYVKPFAKLNKIRSAGITDLRHGSLIDEDWEGIDRFQKLPDNRSNVQLPTEIDCYAIAATKGTKNAIRLKDQIIGDGLVPLKSALGRHTNTDKNLTFESCNTHVLFESNHFDLLDNLDVYNKIKTWFLE